MSKSERSYLAITTSPGIVDIMCIHEDTGTVSNSVKKYRFDATHPTTAYMANKHLAIMSGFENGKPRAYMYDCEKGAQTLLV